MVKRFRWFAVAMAVLVALLVALVAGCGGSQSVRPVQVVPVPAPTISLCTPGINHKLGECLPNPPGLRHFGVGSGITGPDFSNNDPVWGLGNWSAIAARNRFVYLKSIEGAGFFDSTASGMAGLAKAVHLPVGGYDFLHVCWVSASGEAQFFVNSLHAQGLLGPGTLPPAADVEYGSGSCGGLAWVQQWVNTVYALDGHVCPIEYTGAWFSDPNIGGWPSCQGHPLVSWISGYGVSYPSIPSGLGHLNFWQYTDAGFNGASSADLSAWMDSPAAFAAFVNAVPLDPFSIIPHGPFADGNRLVDEYATVKNWVLWGCQNPVRRPKCVTDRDHLIFTRGRISFLAHHVWGTPRHPNWGPNNGGTRWRVENTEINATHPLTVAQLGL